MSDLTLLFAGDFCPTARTVAQIRQQQDKKIFGDVLEELRQKDLSFVNLECALTTRKSGIAKSGPCLKGPAATTRALRLAGFDIAGLANNHIADFGDRAIADTLKTLKQARLKHVGAGMTLAAAQRPLYVKRKGRRIAFLAFAENEFTCADPAGGAGAWPLDPVENGRQIAAARQQADIVIVVIHGGNEYNPMPSPRIVKTYRYFVDNGASAVIGMHPHVPQGHEVHQGAPIFYSTGNFVFDHPDYSWPMWQVGYLVRLTFRGQKFAGFTLVPYRQQRERAGLTLLKGGEKKQFFNHLGYLSRRIPKPAERQRYWDGWCAKMGPGFLRHFDQLTAADIRGAKQKKFLATRNLLRCEAHHELLSHFMDLVRKQRVGQARKYIGRINTLQKGLVPK